MIDYSTSKLNKPINQDVGVSSYEESNIFDCLNLRPITQNGVSTGERENIRGTQEFITVPQASNVWLFTFDLFNAPPYPVQFGLDIVIGNYSFTHLSPIKSSKAEILRDLIITINTYFENLQPGNPEYKTYLSDSEDGIYIINLTHSHTNFLTAITANVPGGFVLNLNKVVDAQVSLPIITGWVASTEGIYLITIGDNNSGQIWKVIYNKHTELSSYSLNPQIQLLYNNILDLDDDHLIHNPTMIKIMEQTPLNHSIYWTDYKNNVRSFNAKNPNSFGISPNNLNLNKKIVWTTPYLNRILQNGGSVKVGNHHFAYRYSNLYGGSTTWSPESHKMIVLEKNDEVESYAEYPTDPDISSKSLEIKINNLDTTFGYLELVHLYTKGDNEITTIEIIDVKFPVTSEFKYIYTGKENTIPITISEFREVQAAIDVAKTIETKDNYLFLGNVKLRKRELTGWDSRAVRFPTPGPSYNGGPSSTTIVYDFTGNSYSIDSNTWTVDSIGIPEDHDCIQPIDPLNVASIGTSQNPIHKGNLLYKYVNGQYIFGGSGPNVEYEFVTESLLSDHTLGNKSPNIYPPQFPYQHATRNISFTLSYNDDNTDMQNVNSWSDYTSPYVSAILGNHMRDEVYAYGIEFYDPYGIPYFVKWIADIRFPHIAMPKIIPNTPVLSYPTSTINGNQLYLHPLGIKFTIKNLDSIKDKISGCRIVRCKRYTKDMTVTSQGMFFNAVADQWDIAQPHYLLPKNLGHTTQTLNGPYSQIGIDSMVDNLGITPSYDDVDGKFDVSPHIASIDSPDYLWGGDFQKITHLDFLTTLNKVGYMMPSVKQDNGTIIYYEDKVLAKYYSFNNPPNAKTAIGYGLYDISEYTIKSAHQGFTENSDDFTLGSRLCRNLDINQDITINGGNYARVCRGDKTVVLHKSDGFLNFMHVTNQYHKLDTIDLHARYLCNTKFNNPKPYNGYTYTERSLRTYIASTNFIPYNSNTEDIKVYSGDTYINIEVNDKFKKGYYVNFDSDYNMGKIHMYPVENRVNLSWQYSTGHPNKNFYKDEFIPQYIDSGINIESSFGGPTAPKYQNLAREYYPMPYPFVENYTYDKRIYATQKKFQDDLFDSWSIIKENDFIDVDMNLGPINGLLRLKNTLYFIQEDAVGVASVNDRVLLQSGETSKLVLGSGDILPRIDYIDTNIGTTHQFSINNSDSSIYFFSAKKLNLFELDISKGTTALNDITGMRSFFKNNMKGSMFNSDNIYKRKGISCVYDFKNYEYLFTFKDTLNDNNDTNEYTIGYSAGLKGFSSRYSHTPYMYIYDKWNLFSVNQGKIWIHGFGNYNHFYGIQYPSLLTIQFNKNAAQTKEFTNLFITGEVVDESNNFALDISKKDIGFESFRFYNSYQNTGTVLFSDIAKRKEDTWNIAIPRDFVINSNVSIFEPSNMYTQKQRMMATMRDKHITVDMLYNDTYKLIMNTVTAKYLISPR